MSASRLLPSVIQQAKKKHTATVIFLHGLGDSGDGWSPVGSQLASKFPHVKFIFPHAPEQPVTLNMGMSMPSWYDIVSLSDINAQQDQEGLLKSVQLVNQLVQAEVDAGIPTKRILLGGFSQGCVVSLLTMLRSEYVFGGLLGLSGYVPLKKTVKSMLSENSKRTPIFWGHGEQDEVVRYAYGTESRDFLKAEGYEVDFQTYSCMGHSACPEEIMAMAAFMADKIPDNV